MMKWIFISGTFGKRIEVVSLFCIFVLSLLSFSCGGGGGADQPASSSAKDITSFSFTSATNSALSQNVTGTISGTNIYATVPNGVSRTALVATFSTTGQDVRIGTEIQESAVTPNNFSGSVSYIVTAQDASTKTYTVVVSEAPASTGAIIADHLAAAAFASIPSTYITTAKTSLHIAYGHTSHGSQITTGMSALADVDSSYAFNSGGTEGRLDYRADMGNYSMPYGAADLGNPDRTTWADATRSYLADHPTINVIIWSWCGQVSSASEADINTYLTLMNQLEQDYPGVKFVYMTGHLDGGGAAGTLTIRNEQIRNYCRTHNKILFDFADIESYDPDGITNFMQLYAADTCSYSGGNWATEWIGANPAHALTTLAASCGSCAHSETLNCVLKGRAVWWLWARLAGWNP